MKFKRKMVAYLTALVLVLSMSVAIAQPGTDIDWNAGVVRVTGEGVGMQKYKKIPGKYRLTAAKAARMDAQAKLVEYMGVQVTTNASMTDYEIDTYVVKTFAEGVVKNAKEIGEPQYFEDGTCKVVMEMKLFGGKGSVAEVAYLPFKDEPKVSFPQPTNATVINQPTIVNNNYTGLVIDCSGMDINCVMSPVIKNASGTKIYGHQNLDYDKIIVNGMASYANNISDQISRSRAGNNPLVVKAVRLEDLSANPVVSVEDADRILAANQHDRFLENCAVVFVR